MTSVRTSRFAVGPAVLVALVLMAAVAVAQPAGPEGTVVVEIDEALTVAEGDTIHGSLIVMGGRAWVLGRIAGDLIVVDGRATLGPTARIDGDALTVRGTIDRHELAQVAGEQKKLTAAEFARAMAGLGATGEGKAEEEPEPPAEEPVDAEEPADEEPAESEAPATVAREQREVRGDLSSFGQPITVPADEIRVGSIAALGGPVTIDGTVRGDVASFGGAVNVRGEVRGQIAGFGGPVRLEAGSHVTGDIATFGARVDKAPGAIHDGQVAEMGGGLPSIMGGRGSAPARAEESALGAWGAGTVSALLVALLIAGLLPNATRTVADTIAVRPGSAFAHGGLTLLLFAPVCAILVISCVGAVLVPFVGLGLLAAFALGLVGINLLVGRRLVLATHWRIASVVGLAVLGVGALRVLALLGFVLGTTSVHGVAEVAGLVAGLIWLALVTFAIGGALMTGFGTRADGEWITRRFAGRAPAAGVTADDAGTSAGTPADDGPAGDSEVGAGP